MTNEEFAEVRFSSYEIDDIFSLLQECCAIKVTDILGEYQYYKSHYRKCLADISYTEGATISPFLMNLDPTHPEL